MKSSRRAVLAGLCLFILNGCARDTSRTDGDAASEPLRVAMIPKGASHVFWKSVHAGALKAEQELEADGTAVELIWKGPLKEDDRSAQINVVENFISQQVDAICLAPLDDNALVAPVERARRAGVPVVVFDSGLNSEKIVSYIATDNYKGGRLAGEYLARVLDGRGNVVLLRYMEGSASTEERERGFLDAISEHPEIKIISDNLYAGATRATAQESSENLLNRFADDADGIFCPNESSTVGMLLALRSIGKAQGAIKLVGFDGGEQNIQALRADDIQGLVLQDPVRMGYLSLKVAVQHLQGKPYEKQIDTGSTLVTLENVDDPELEALINPPLAEYLD